MGLRELKKEQVRQQIANAAWQLFSERGFEEVTVTEVARKAQVAPATVFNQFPAKEDLFYSGLDVFGARLVATVGARAAGVSVLAAMRTFMADTSGFLELVDRGDADALDRLRTVHRVIAGSPALLAREQQTMAHCTAALADLIAEESGASYDEVSTQVVANALTGTHQAMITLVRRRILAEDRLSTLASDVRDAMARAFSPRAWPGRLRTQAGEPAAMTQQRRPLRENPCARSSSRSRNRRGRIPGEVWRVQPQGPNRQALLR